MVSEMPKKKRSTIVLWISIFFILVSIAYLVIDIQIPCTSLIQRYLEKKFSETLKEINLETGNISLDLKGHMQIAYICLGDSQVIRVTDAEAGISPLKLLRGRLVVNSITGDLLQIKRHEWKQLVEVYEDTANRCFRESMSNTLGNTVLKFNHFSLLDTGGSRPASGRRLFLKLHSSEDGGVKGKVRLQRLFFPNVPPMKFINFFFGYNQREIYVKKFRADWMKGSLKARFTLPLDSTELHGGSCSFNSLNLGQMTEKGFFGSSVLRGQASGSLLFKGLVGEKYSYDMDGRLRLKKVRIKNFLFQKDAVITNYMPELTDVKLDVVELGKCRIRKEKIYIDTIWARGNPLSLQGRGTMTFKGDIDLYLTCYLEEDYYQNLKELVQDGIRRDSLDRPVFECQIKGNAEDQKIYFDKVISRVVKKKLQRIGRKIRSLFQ
jgi:hypothetical protein